MSAVNQLDLIWLSELNLVILYPVKDLDVSFASAAIIIKGEDGTDLFVPYDGLSKGAPIAFSLGPSLQEGAYFSLSVLGFKLSGEPIELAVFQLDKEFVPHLYLSGEATKSLDMQVVGFGQYRCDGDEPGSANQPGDIGISSADYQIEERVDYSQLLATYLYDMRSVERDNFTGFFITGVPRLDQIIGPAVHLRPLHHYQFGLQLRSMQMELDLVEDEGFDELDETGSSPIEGAAILSRHASGHLSGGGAGGGFGVRDVPEFTLHAGPAREAVDFILRNGLQVHWRRQLETWNLDHLEQSRSDDRHVQSFLMAPVSERDNLVQQDGDYFFHWAVEEAIIGDVVGMVFASDHASIDMNVLLDDQNPISMEAFGLFIFMGDEFVPLTQEILMLPENQGIVARLESHIDQGIKQSRAKNYLALERVRLASRLFERDKVLQNLVGSSQLQALADQSPFGPELMVYRDHVLHAWQEPDMALWLKDLFGSALSSGRGRLVDSLRFETFKKVPALAHALVFNEPFRQAFGKRSVDPHSFQMPILEYLLGKFFSDRLIEWALRLKGESQAVLWHLALKRPAMVERLYELKLEPDLALNPFDERALDHAEAALSDSSHIDVEIIEQKVMPVLKALEDEGQLEALEDFAQGLKFGAEGKKLNIGELSVCLGAVEQAQTQWQAWIDEAWDVFKPLLQPLELNVVDFETGEDFSVSADLRELRQEIGRFIGQLSEELGCDEEAVQKAQAFIETVEADVFLQEIRQKLDLALKYHHDLSVGVEQIMGAFEVDEQTMSALNAIKPQEWPTMEHFGPTFAKPFVERQVALQTKFDAQVKAFAQKVHPDDGLFYATLQNSLSELGTVLPKLVWLNAGQELEHRVAKVRSGLSEALLSVGPLSSKLRRSKGVSQAVKQLVVAERMGPSGWPIINQSLEIIEKNLEVSPG